MKWVLFAMYMTATGPVDVVDPTLAAQQHRTIGKCSAQLVEIRQKLIASKLTRYLVCEPIKIEDISAARAEHALKFQQDTTF